MCGILTGMHKEGRQGSYNYRDIQGDVPGNLPTISGEILINSSAVSPARLEKEIEEFKIRFPDVIKKAKEEGRDLVAVVKSHGTIIAVGVGIATVLAGVSVYEHKKHSSKNKAQSK